jgi:hypothetical protein
MRNFWQPQELKDLALPWPDFHELWPSRSYDAYEVKRRRIQNGSAGHGRPPIYHRHSVSCVCRPFLIHREPGDVITGPINGK